MSTSQATCASGYSLWLMPEKVVASELDQAIADLAFEFGLPIFKAHITIAGGFNGFSEPMAAMTKYLAAQHAPVEVLSAGYATTLQYFKHCYMVVQPTTGVLTLRYLAKQRFGLVGDEYDPHLSMAYGSIPFHRQRDVLRMLRSTMSESFMADSISLVHTQGPVDAWAEIINVPLTGR